MKYTRLSGKPVQISPEAADKVIKAIKANPNQTVRDYEAATLVSVNTINLVLECTPQGQKLVREGKVAYVFTRGRTPAWVDLKGATIKAPAANYVPALFRSSVALTHVKTPEIASDASTLSVLATEALSRPSSSPTRRKAKLELIQSLTNAMAAREEERANRVAQLEAEIATLERYNTTLERTVELERERASVQMGNLSGLLPAPAQTANNG